MKVILSRKGFDSKYGGCASPLLKDGIDGTAHTLLSMPIPDDSGMKYDELTFGDRTYLDIWQDLNKKADSQKYAHLDPDIRRGVRKNQVDRWEAIFGQCGAAQSHLENQKVDVDDVFLFFGWFKETEIKEGHLSYVKGAKDKHIIYGYLQIGEIVTGENRHKYSWHPHSADYDVKNNTMYIASKNLFINGKDTGLPGAGIFNYSPDLVLTKEGCSRSRWELPEIFKNVNISHHSKDSFKGDYFQSAAIGQEFVISENDNVTEWAEKIIRIGTKSLN